ncbi:hypothetical protein [Bradyrhizobium sp. S3.2.6]|uniref:hypothetical protein n=1 Tax=Bradyrhizobium sp. S3.2.6 TaxID=3156428 RepID=UPI003399513D
MKQFEDEVVLFLKDALEDKLDKALTEQEQVSLAGWLALITILAEYADNAPPTTGQKALLALQKTRLPPDGFHIYVSRSKGPKWNQWYVYHNFHFNDAGLSHVRIMRDGRPRYNTQVTTMGIGNLLAHVFSGPDTTTLQSYSIAVEGSKLERIWPPKESFWVKQALWLRPQTLLKFPMKSEFSDNEADALAATLKQRIAAMNRQPRT